MRNLHSLALWWTHLLHTHISFPRCFFPFHSNHKTKLAANTGRESAGSFPQDRNSRGSYRKWTRVLRVHCHGVLGFPGEPDATVVLASVWPATICYQNPSSVTWCSKGQYSRDKFWLGSNMNFIQESGHLGRRWTLVQSQLPHFCLAQGVLMEFREYSSL